MKYMGSHYHTLSTEKLKKLRSQKHARIQKLENDPQGYFHKYEMARLRTQIGWLDAVLAARAAQMTLI